MSLCLETLLICDGVPHHLDYHNTRFNTTRKDLFNKAPLDLQTVLTPPQGTWRCRILYDDHIHSIEYLPLSHRSWECFALIDIDSSFAYPYKYANRDYFDKLKAHAPSCDDILMVKEGMITDTTIANIAFWDGQRWVTPAKPLLYGTTRQRLLDEGLLTVATITPEDIQHFSHMAIMNALIGFVPLTPKIIKSF